MNSKSQFGGTVIATLLFLSGCADNPGTWGPDRIEKKLMERFDLEEVSVQVDPAGGLTGSGKDTNGETFTFKITQDPAAHRLSWDAEGDRGTYEDGFFELK